VSIFVSKTPVVVTSVFSPVDFTFVSPSEESDTYALDSSSTTVGSDETADSSLISLLIASNVSGLERVESSSSTNALEMSSNVSVTGLIVKSTSYST